MGTFSEMSGKRYSSVARMVFLFSSCILFIGVYLSLLIQRNAGYAYTQGDGCDVWYYFGLSLVPDVILSDPNLHHYQQSRLALWFPLYVLEGLSGFTTWWSGQHLNLLTVSIFFSFLLALLYKVTRNLALSAPLGLVISTSPLVLHHSTHAEGIGKPFWSVLFGYVAYVFCQRWNMRRDVSLESSLDNVPLYFGVSVVIFLAYAVSLYFFAVLVPFLLFFVLARLLYRSTTSDERQVFPELLKMAVSAVVAVAVCSLVYIGIFALVYDLSVFTAGRLLLSQFVFVLTSTSSLQGEMQSVFRDPYGVLVPLVGILIGLGLFKQPNPLTSEGTERTRASFGLASLSVGALWLAMFLFSNGPSKDKANVALFVLVSALVFFFAKEVSLRGRPTRVGFSIGSLALCGVSVLLQYFVLPTTMPLVWNYVVLTAALILMGVSLVPAGNGRTISTLALILLTFFVLGNYYNRNPWRGSDYGPQSAEVRRLLEIVKTQTHPPFLILGPEEEMGSPRTANGALWRSLNHCRYRPPEGRTIKRAIRETELVTGSKRVHVLFFRGLDSEQTLLQLGEQALGEAFKEVHRHTFDGFTYVELEVSSPG